MGRKLCDDAIVLRTYNVADADRFCILLTRTMGRIPVRANGVRKMLSRRGGTLLPPHRIHVTLQEHGSVHTVTDAACLDAYPDSARTLAGFSCMQQGIELLLKFVGDGEPVTEVYNLAQEFLELCEGTKAHSRLLSLFTLKLLSLLGLAPSAASSDGMAMTTPLSSQASALLSRLPDDPLTALIASALPSDRELASFAQRLLGIQLGSPLASLAVGNRLSPASTPICQ